jgi:hypothetical protein
VTRESRMIARARAQAFVNEVNRRMVCARCGAQPIEWHNPSHIIPGQKGYRISNMASGGRANRLIQAEMDRCTPLCRRCHMAEDGRIRNLSVGHPGTMPSPCDRCGREYKPLRKGLCHRCADRAYQLKRRAV